MLRKRNAILGAGMVGVIAIGALAYTDATGYTAVNEKSTIGHTSITASGGSVTALNYTLDDTANVEHVLLSILPTTGYNNFVSNGEAEPTQVKVQLGIADGSPVTGGEYNLSTCDVTAGADSDTDSTVDCTYGAPVDPVQIELVTNVDVVIANSATGTESQE